MKKFKTLFIALALIFGATAFSSVQAQTKVAHIASQELIESMPEYKAAMAQLDKLQQTYDAEIKTMLTEASNTMKRYQNEANTKTEEENAKRAQELQATEQSIAQYRQNALKDLQKKEMELLKPIYEKARVSVQKVAREKGFDYVLDSTTGTGVIMADGYNLMPDVKKDLGI